MTDRHTITLRHLHPDAGYGDALQVQTRGAGDLAQFLQTFRAALVAAGFSLETARAAVHLPPQPERDALDRVAELRRALAGARRGGP